MIVRPKLGNRRTWIIRVYVAVMVAFLCVAALPVAASAPQLTEYDVPIGKLGSLKHAAVTSDGMLWFGNQHDNALGKMAPDGKVDTYSVAVGHTKLVAFAPDKAGNIWATLSWNAVGDVNRSYIVKVAPNGYMTPFAVPDAATNRDLSLGDITVAPDGTVWAVQSSPDTLLKLSPAGTFSSVGLADNQKPTSLATTPDGTVWFTNAAGGAIGKVAGGGQITQYPLAQGGAPDDLIVFDNALWYTRSDTNAVGRVNMTTGAMVDYSFNSVFNGPQEKRLTQGADGAVWMTLPGSNTLARVALDGTVTQYPLAGSARPTDIVSGPGNRIWVVQAGLDKIGYFTVQPPQTQPPAPGPETPAPDGPGLTNPVRPPGRVLGSNTTATGGEGGHVLGISTLANAGTETVVTSVIAGLLVAVAIIVYAGTLKKRHRKVMRHMPSI